MDIQISTTALEQIYATGNDGILVQDVEEELVILAVTQGEYYKLNEVGARIWALVNEGKSLQEVLAALMDEYDVSEERMTADLMSLLAELQSQGLLEIHGK